MIRHNKKNLAKAQTHTKPQFQITLTAYTIRSDPICTKYPDIDTIKAYTKTQAFADAGEKKRNGMGAAGKIATT